MHCMAFESPSRHESSMGSNKMLIRGVRTSMTTFSPMFFTFSPVGSRRCAQRTTASSTKG